ncbi:molybdate transport system ATP-binding protein [Alteromonadaceae bacterium 2753L.S.0a.02]|nr:molybdate transport system ATP-binding protein [Alteromonadaceae bacterium 2753L.S.0a.02]
MGEISVKVFLKRNEFTLNVDIVLPGNGVTVFYGHSGSGKTTLLRTIAGLERVANATIVFNNQQWQSQTQFTPVHHRPLGYVFQEPSLFEHLSARANLAFAQKRARKNSHNIDFQQVVELLGISQLLERYPAQLSGGERQRVAIARALLVNPQLLLMDEPLASLDQARKLEILPYLEKLKRELQLPIIYVTHAPDEVAHLADHLIVLDKGQVVASGTLAQTLSRLDFPVRLGEDAGVVVEARITERDQHWQLAKISFPGGHLWFRDNGISVGETVRVRILARDVSLSLTEHDDTSIINILPAEVLELNTDDHASLTLVRLKLDTTIIVARVSSRSATKLQIAPGKKFWAQIKSVAIVQ